jgi:small subunit ribosomal protein S16
MATALRLLRTGTTKRPVYRMVVIDQARANKGGIIENLGMVPVLQTVDKPQLNAERIKYWLSTGVVTSESAKGVLKGLGLWAAPAGKKPQSAKKKAAKAAKPKPVAKKK